MKILKIFFITLLLSFTLKSIIKSDCATLYAKNISITQTSKANFSAKLLNASKSKEIFKNKSNSTIQYTKSLNKHNNKSSSLYNLPYQFLIVYILTITCLSIVFSFYITHKYSQKHNNKRILSIVVIAQFLVFQMIFLLPIDLSISIGSKGSNGFLNQFSINYQVAFILMITALPLLQDYSMAGDFTRIRRFLTSLKINGLLYSFIATLFIAFLIYISIKYGSLTFNNFVALCIALSNAQGLILLVISLGYGLVEVPRYIWHQYGSLDPLHKINYYYCKIALLNDRFEIAKEKFDQISDCVDDCRLRISIDDSNYRWFQKLDLNCLKYSNISLDSDLDQTQFLNSNLNKTDSNSTNLFSKLRRHTHTNNNERDLKNNPNNNFVQPESLKKQKACLASLNKQILRQGYEMSRLSYQFSYYVDKAIKMKDPHLKNELSQHKNKSKNITRRKPLYRSIKRTDNSRLLTSNSNVYSSKDNLKNGDLVELEIDEQCAEVEEDEISPSDNIMREQNTQPSNFQFRISHKFRNFIFGSSNSFNSINTLNSNNSNNNINAINSSSNKLKYVSLNTNNTRENLSMGNNVKSSLKQPKILIPIFLQRLLSVLTAIFSVLIMYSELTLLVYLIKKTPQSSTKQSAFVSIFSLSLFRFNNISILRLFFGFILISYIALCSMYGLFRFKVIGYYEVYQPRGTHLSSLILSASIMLRITLAISYNFLILTGQSQSSSKSILTKFIGRLDIVPFLGRQFAVFMPILISLVSLLTLLNASTRLLKCLGLDDDLSWVGFLASDISLIASQSTAQNFTSEGKIIIRREIRRLNALGNTEVAILPSQRSINSPTHHKMFTRNSKSPANSKYHVKTNNIVEKIKHKRFNEWK